MYSTAIYQIIELYQNWQEISVNKARIKEHLEVIEDIKNIKFRCASPARILWVIDDFLPFLPPIEFIRNKVDKITGIDKVLFTRLEGFICKCLTHTVNENQYWNLNICKLSSTEEFAYSLLISVKFYWQTIQAIEKSDEVLSKENMEQSSRFFSNAMYLCATNSQINQTINKSSKIELEKLFIEIYKRLQENPNLLAKELLSDIPKGEKRELLSKAITGLKRFGIENIEAVKKLNEIIWMNLINKSD